MIYSKERPSWSDGVWHCPFSKEITELSGKVNGANGTPQAFALLKVVNPSA